MARSNQPARPMWRGVALLAPWVAGCAGLQTQVPDASQPVEGVAYFMPRKDFVLTVHLKDSTITSLAWSESATYPDLGRTFALQYRPHLVGRTTVQVEVSPIGLLGRANTATTESPAALATVSSVAAGSGILATDLPSDPCAGAGERAIAWHLEQAGEGELCNGRIRYRIKPVPRSDGARTSAPAPFLPASDTTAPGVYYRVNRPYLATVSAEAEGLHLSRLLFVPNESPAYLLPLGRTLFAANDGKVEFSEGILKRYDQADDGELAALLKFPASVLDAYFTAVGNVFSAFSRRDQREVALQQVNLELDIRRFRIERCEEALRKADTAALQTLACNALGDE